nr:hypothetical protein [Tanacetum cinerariifolium]GFB13106.1 hypothetical protein [Tanacetum cinerariifolium]
MCSTDYVIEGRAHSTDLAKLTRQAQPSADRIGEALGIVLAEEAALSGETLLMEIVLRVETALAADRSRYAKRGRDSESLLSRVSESGFSNGGHWKSKSKRHKPTDEDDLMMP